MQRTTYLWSHRMVRKRLLQLLLGFMNLLFLLIGLAMIGYGIYMVLAYNSSSLASLVLSDGSCVKYDSMSSSSTDEKRLTFKTALEFPSPHPSTAPASDKREVSPIRIDDDARGQLQLRKIVSRKFKSLELPSTYSFWDNLPAAWFLEAILFLGAIITLIACSGYIAASTIYTNCLHCYAFFVFLVMLVELTVASFIFYDGSWQKFIPTDSTGQLNILEEFIEEKFNIFKWIALGVIILQVLALFLSIILLAISSAARRCYYDSDDDSISRSALLNRQQNGDTDATQAAYGSK